MRPGGRGEGFAAAKVNLCLHVGPRESDGYHPIASLMVFADVGDRIAIGGETLTITGPLAQGLSSGSDNLVGRAKAAFEQATGLTAPGLILEKTLPMGAGLGGGSADAAATLRLLNAQAERPLARPALEQIAGRLGSDVPACLNSTSVIAEGRGERLSAAPRLPVLDAVLAHPGVGSSTPAVYRAFDAAKPAGGDPTPPAVGPGLGDLDAVIGFLAATRNDLQAPAVALQPAIGEALEALEGAPEARFVRMTGSGSAVFALCDGRDRADAMAARLGRAHPHWWVRAVRLGAK